MLKVFVVLLIVCVLGQSQVTEECQSVGQSCGGVRQVKCCLGQHLKCIYNTPIHPEANGICQKVCSKEGEYCGGFTADPHICCSGLSCVIRDNRIPDLPGNCKNSSTNPGPIYT